MIIIINLPQSNIKEKRKQPKTNLHREPHFKKVGRSSKYRAESKTSLKPPTIPQTSLHHLVLLPLRTDHSDASLSNKKK